jgi:hypothetical protein
MDSIMGAGMTTCFFATTLIQGDRTRSFEVRRASQADWEASESADKAVTVRRLYTDWHRVERALLSFSRTIEELRRQGWREAGSTLLRESR